MNTEEGRDPADDPITCSCAYACRHERRMPARARTRNFDSEVVHNALYLLFLGMLSTVIELKDSSVLLHGLPFEEDYSAVTVTNLIDITLFFVLTDSVRLIARAVLDWSLRTPDCDVESEEAVNVLSYVTESSSKSLTTWSSAALLIMVMAINVLPNFALQFGGSRNYVQHSSSATCRQETFTFTAVGGRVNETYTVTGAEMAYRMNIGDDAATEAAVIDKGTFLLVPTQIVQTSSLSGSPGLGGRRRNYYVTNVPTVQVTKRDFSNDVGACKEVAGSRLNANRSRKFVDLFRLDCPNERTRVVAIVVSEVANGSTYAMRYNQTIGLTVGLADVSFETAETGRSASSSGVFTPSDDMTKSVQDFSKLTEDMPQIALNLAGFKFSMNNSGNIWKSMGVMIAVKAAADGNVLDGGTDYARVPHDRSYKLSTGMSCMSIEALVSVNWYWNFRLALVIALFLILMTIAFEGNVVGGTIMQSAALLQDEVDAVSWSCAPEWLIESMRRRGADIESHHLENKLMKLEVVSGAGFPNCYLIDRREETLYHLRLLSSHVDGTRSVRKTRLPSIFEAFIPIMRASMRAHKRKALGWARLCVMATLFVPAVLLVAVAGVATLGTYWMSKAKRYVLRWIERKFPDSVDGAEISMTPVAPGTYSTLILQSPPISMVRAEWGSIMVA